MFRNNLPLAIVLSLLVFTSCKQQKLKVLPGAVLTNLDGSEVNKSLDKSGFDGHEMKEGTKIILSSDLLFSFNSSVLSDKSKEELNKLVRLLNTNKSKLVRLDGYTDITGPLWANIKLSEQRALAVKKYLIESGISETRISTKGLGPANPVGDNETSEGRKINRRVEVVFL